MMKMLESRGATAISMKRWGVVLGVLAICGLASLIVVVASQSFGYFPAGVLDPKNASSDSFKRGWYSNMLRAMNEPALVPNEGKRAFRFTWLRSFHHPVTVRVDQEGDHYLLNAVEMDGQGGYGPGKVYRRHSKSLSADESRQLDELIRKPGFWSLPSEIDELGFDGAQWIIEGVTDEYHVVDRWSPKSGPVRNLGERFLSLTGWEFDPMETY